MKNMNQYQICQHTLDKLQSKLSAYQGTIFQFISRKEQPSMLQVGAFLNELTTDVQGMVDDVGFITGYIDSNYDLLNKEQNPERGEATEDNQGTVR